VIELLVVLGIIGLVLRVDFGQTKLSCPGGGRARTLAATLQLARARANRATSKRLYVSIAKVEFGAASAMRALPQE